ncbi:hypothetical protein [Bremerella sp.]|uniref:hypothetical protein n=1 Tax=Bremerella sp. TaxID=2795602 RepID=UPI003918F2FA
MNRAASIHDMSPQQVRHELATLFARGILRLMARRSEMATGDSAKSSGSEKSPAAGLEDA